MVKTSQKLPKRKPVKELDSVYFFKLVMYFLIGTFWVHISTSTFTIPLPLGFIIGVAFASHDHFKIDRKIEYAVLLVAMFVTYFLVPRFIIAL